MARLIYAALASLDGYTADREGAFDWAAPDEEVHAFVNDLERGIGTYLYGRRMYETMRVWETMDVSDEPPPMRDYAEVWRAAEKVVYSATLHAATTPRTELVREFDPEEVRARKQRAAADLAIGGPTLAASAFRAGLVDDIHLILSPVIVGGGTRALPDDVRLDLELVGERRFSGGAVHLRYRVF